MLWQDSDADVSGQRAAGQREADRLTTRTRRLSRSDPGDDIGAREFRGFRKSRGLRECSCLRAFVPSRLVRRLS